MTMSRGKELLHDEFTKELAKAKEEWATQKDNAAKYRVAVTLWRQLQEQDRLSDAEKKLEAARKDQEQAESRVRWLEHVLSTLDTITILA